ncbi:MAG: hypothetical protein LC721_04555 [Actinobacteria bacterium]|nr:hypothetical protein [Actinomycetota bacterium]
MVDDVYRGRIDALKHAWQVSGRLGRDLTGQQWSRLPCCPGWEHGYECSPPVSRHQPLLWRQSEATQRVEVRSCDFSEGRRRRRQGPAWPTLDAIGDQTFDARQDAARFDAPLADRAAGTTEQDD